MNRAYLYILVVAILFSACGKEKAERSSSDEDVLAHIEDLSVSEAHFKAAFKKYYYQTGQGIPINSKTRFEVLKHELDRYSVVKFAQDRNWHTTQIAQHEKEIIRRKVLVEEYERRILHEKVGVTEEDMKTLFKRFNTRVKASHIYAPTKREIDSLYNLLQDGYSWERMASEVFSDPRLSDNGGNLGYFSVDEMDPAFENVAFKLPLNTISPPVKTTQGWSIVKVTDKVSKPILTKNQFANKKHQIYQYALKRNREMATRRDIQDKAEAFDIPDQLLREMWAAVKADKGEFQKEVVEGDQLRINLESIDDPTLTDYADFTFTAQDFLREAYYTSAKRRSKIRNFHDFRMFVEGLVYRSYCIDRIQESPKMDQDFVESSVKETFYDYLNRRFKDHLYEVTEVPEEKIRDKYEKDPDSYEKPLELNIIQIVTENKEKADAAYSALQNNIATDRIIAQYAANDPYVDNGNLGFVPITKFGNLRRDLADLQKGDLFGPQKMQSKEMYVVIKCLGRKESRPMSYEEAKPEIRDVLMSSAIKRKRSELISETKQKYNAQIFKEKLETVPVKL